MDDDTEDKKTPVVAFVTTRGILGLYFDPDAPDCSPHDVDQLPANVIPFPQSRTVH